jgi:YgiT-type zinc finger domain-containing protein
MKSMVTNLPFKINETTIVILKDLPVLQCNNCNEYLLDDPVMKRVDEILEKVDTAAELEVIRYAA